VEGRGSDLLVIYKSYTLLYLRSRDTDTHKKVLRVSKERSKYLESLDLWRGLVKPLSV
jgi:hypothetical protein